ncbi:sperm acrosome-associated protein 9 [Coregonus clupeaformis]|uniref:sperm acrosome-associated protein 9 n=1 Tax=Coregonus clupeaformis TaxID=59861 RepID=UPI001E1C296E|nr:sperm acrosome-associated protein 9 [Coregonus clupeaformis]
MSEARERLKAIEHMRKLFKQQQFIFIAALERSREHAHDRTEPVASVMQVQGYMEHHCSNATDRRIFTLFLKIVGELRDFLRLLEGANQSPGGGILDTYRLLLSYNCNISKLQAHYPHDEVNRLSCDEARNYYSGVVSLIPLALELLQRMASSYTYCSQDNPSAGNPNVDVLESSAQRGGTAGVGDMSFSLTGHAAGGHNTRQTQAKRAGAWHASKPAWRPPGLTARIRH